MVQVIPVPFLVYWLIVKDFLYKLDVCINKYDEVGYCLSNLQCSNIVQGKHIGSCDSDELGSVCCKITLNYFNNTYVLSPFYAKKSKTEMTQKMMLFTAIPRSRFEIQYGNRNISLESKKKMVSPNSVLHHSKSPDKIVWPIYVSRESGDLKKQVSGQNYLYIVTLDKLELDESTTSERLIESDTSKSDEDKFYVLLNTAENFPINKSSTGEIQKVDNMNSTMDLKSLFENKSDSRNPRSVYHGMRKERNSTCKKQEFEDIFDVENKEGIDFIQSSYEIAHDFHKQVKTLSEQKKIKNVHNYVLGSKPLFRGFKEQKDKNKLPTIKIPNTDGKTHPTLVTHEPVYDSIETQTDDGKESTFKYPRTSMLLKGDSFFVKGDTMFEEKNMHPPLSIDNMRYAENLSTHSLQELAQKETSHNEKYLVHVENDRKKPVHGENILDMRKSVLTHYLRKPAQIEDTHNLRIPVQTENTRNMRKTVQGEPYHDMRIPVQISNDHNMRKPIQNFRESVKRELTHDLRKPVSSDDSHDLRWPVLEGETDLRSLATDRDEFEKLHDSKFKHSSKNDENSFNFSLDCNADIKESSVESVTGKKQAQKTDVLKETNRVCGKYSEDAKENSTSKMKDEWPWMVFLHEIKSGKYSHKCSASLLNDLWVITVAHCVDMKPISNFKVVLGNPNRDHDNYIERTLIEIVIHPKFNRGLFENDIALMRMKGPVAFQSSISPICLPWSMGELKYGTPVFLGWELKSKRTRSFEKLMVPVMTNYECEILYSTGKNKEKIKETFLCAGKDDGNCDSESGSSLIALNTEERWSLIGLVSWGSMCTNLEQPGVYTRVASYVQWIKDVIDCYENLL